MIEEKIPDWVKHDVDEALSCFDFSGMESGFYFIEVAKCHENLEIEEWCATLPASKLDSWYGRPSDADQDETPPLTWRDCQDIKEIVHIR